MVDRAHTQLAGSLMKTISGIYLDMRRLSEDVVVPEIAILWGAHHNVQHVSKHGFEQYLLKDPVDLPENCSEPQRYIELL